MKKYDQLYNALAHFVGQGCFSNSALNFYFISLNFLLCFWIDFAIGLSYTWKMRMGEGRYIIRRQSLIINIYESIL